MFYVCILYGRVVTIVAVADGHTTSVHVSMLLVEVPPVTDHIINRDWLSAVVEARTVADRFGGKPLILL